VKFLKILLLLTTVILGSISTLYAQSGEFVECNSLNYSSGEYVNKTCATNVIWSGNVKELIQRYNLKKSDFDIVFVVGYFDFSREIGSSNSLFLNDVVESKYRLDFDREKNEFLVESTNEPAAVESRISPMSLIIVIFILMSMVLSVKCIELTLVYLVFSIPLSFALVAGGGLSWVLIPAFLSIIVTEEISKYFYPNQRGLGLNFLSSIPPCICFDNNRGVVYRSRFKRCSDAMVCLMLYYSGTCISCIFALSKILGKETVSVKTKNRFTFR
jgi:hypothetical protein